MLAWALGATFIAAACDSEVSSAEGPPRNLLLISVDTLRADHLGCYGYERATSPAIDRLASESVLFERSYATSSWTLPTLASLMTSHYSATHGCIDDASGLSEDFDTLAEVLDRAGFTTGAIVNHLYLETRFGLNQGFGEYDDELISATMRASHEAITSSQVTDKAIAWLEANAADQDSPWFLWAHYFDPHDLYMHHEGTSEPFARESPWGSSYGDIDLYDGEIGFTDAHIGRLLDTLSTFGLADDTLVVFVADHGEEFREHGGRGHRQTLYRETVQVPLLLRAPGLPSGRMEHPVSMVDVYPTVLELLGIDAVPGLAGRSLVPAILEGVHDPERPILAELHHRRIQLSSIQRGRWRLIHDRHAGRLELYDIVEDPAEQQNLAEAEPEIAAQLAAELVQELRRAKERAEAGSEARRIELTPMDEQRIRDLGYAGDEE